MAKKKVIEKPIKEEIKLFNSIELYGELVNLKYDYASSTLNTMEYWFVKEQGLKIIIYYSLFHEKWFLNDYVTDVKAGVNINHSFPDKGYDNYDEALLVALNILLTILKSKK